MFFVLLVINYEEQEFDMYFKTYFCNLKVAFVTPCTFLLVYKEQTLISETSRRHGKEKFNNWAKIRKRG